MNILEAIWILFLTIWAIWFGIAGCRDVHACIFPSMHANDYEVRIMGFIMGVFFLYVSYVLFSIIL